MRVIADVRLLKVSTALVAKSKLFAKLGAKPRQPVLIGLGLPARSPRGSFSCRVVLRGFDRPREIHGEDSMQALALALAFLRMRLQWLKDQGWLFYFGPRDRQAFDVVSCWYPRWTQSRRKQPNRAIDSDTYSAPLRAPSSARHRGR
jgi:hypothetical protein